MVKKIPENGGDMVAKKKNELWEWIKALIIAVLLAAVIRYFLFAPIVVDGLSMMPTLHDQDRMIVINLVIELENQIDLILLFFMRLKIKIT